MNDIIPKVDFAFKKLFGTEDNKELLISLINSILSEDDQIVSLVIINPYNFAQFGGENESLLNIKAKDANGTYLNIEMQVGTEVSSDKRSLYYWSNLVANQLKRDAIYEDMTKTICINILDNNIIKDTDDYHSEYKILNTKTGKDDGLHGALEIHYIELRKFKKEYYELTSSLDRWITFLNKANKINKNKLPEELVNDNIIVKAFTLIEVLFNDKERETYENRLKYHTTIFSSLVSSENKGEKRGERIGLKKGIKIGEERGAKKARLEIAKGLIKVMTASKIQKLTGLPLEEIEALFPVQKPSQNPLIP